MTIFQWFAITFSSISFLGRLSSWWVYSPWDPTHVSIISSYFFSGWKSYPRPGWISSVFIILYFKVEVVKTTHFSYWSWYGWPQALQNLQFYQLPAYSFSLRPSSIPFLKFSRSFSERPACFFWVLWDYQNFSILTSNSSHSAFDAHFEGQLFSPFFSSLKYLTAISPSFLIFRLSH